MPPAPDCVRFVAAVRRRMWAHRVLESAVPASAVAAMAGAVAGRWTPAAATPIALLVALTVVVVLVTRRRPTLAAAAHEIDSQFGWHELVQSARAVSSTRDEVGQAVVSLANANCRSARIGELSLGRFTSRNVILAVVLLVAAVAIRIAPATAGGAASTPSDDDLAESMNRPGATAAVAPRSNPSETRAGEPDEPTRRSGGAEDERRLSRISTADRAGHSTESAGGVSSGAAGGHPPASVTPPADVFSPTPAAGGSTVASGNGTSAAATPGSGFSSGVVTPAASTAASPWSSSADLPAADPTSTRTANSSSIPPADADLVRAFFAR